MSKTSATPKTKTPPSAQTPSPAGSFDKKDKTFSVIGLNKTGAVNYAVSPQYKPGDILIACDVGHPAYETHSPQRYSLTDPDNQADLDSILTDGLLQSPLVVIIGNRPVCAEGSRRVALLREIERRQVEAGGDPLLIECKVKRFENDSDASTYCIKAHASANEHRKDDNPMSRARKMRLMFKGIPGATEGTWMVAPMSYEDIGARFKVQGKVVEEVLGDKGLFALCPEIQAALELPPDSPGYITQSSGFHIAGVKDFDTQRACYARVTNNGTQRADRDETRKLAREVSKTGKLPPLAETSEVRGGGKHEVRDYKPTRSALETLRGKLREFADDKAGSVDHLLAVVEFFLDPAGTSLDEERFDKRIVEAVRASIKPPKSK